MLTEDDIKQRYPLHVLIWNNSIDALRDYLSLHSKNIDLEQKDNRQRTPLMLATALDRKECIRILLEHNALVNVTDHTGFNVLHEAVTTADPKLIRDVYFRKELQRINSIRFDGIPSLLKKICNTTDFYLEMKWEFTSWIPLISQFCPSDTYRIYKRGSKVRIDSTLVGMDELTSNDNFINWQRGNTSLILSGSENGCEFIEIDHNKRTVSKRTMELILPDEVNDMLGITDDQLIDRLTQPIKTMYVDTEKIHFERCKSGFIGFRTDRSEMFNGYDCKVYQANNVEFITKTRFEHLTQEDKKRYKKLKDSSSSSALSTIIGIHGQNIMNPFENDSEFLSNDELRRNPYKLSLVDYFNLLDDDQRDIGSPREMNIKKQYFKANLWISDDYPLSLKEQILPIVDMVATYSSHFAKLRDFITCKLPAGFPVKIEIPLFHLLNAKITFGNVFGHDQAVDGIKLIPDDNNSSDSKAAKCIVDEKCFDAPDDYQILDNGSILSMFNMNTTNSVIDNDNDDDQEYVKQLLNKCNRINTKNNDNDDSIDVNDAKSGAKTSNSATTTNELSIMEALNYDSEKDLLKALQLSLIEYNQRKDSEAQIQTLSKQHSAKRSLKSNDHESNSIEKSLKNNDNDGHDQNEINDKCSIESDELSYQSCDNNNNNDSNANNDEQHSSITAINDNNHNSNDIEEQLIRMTMEQSKHDHDEMERRRKIEEDELFERVIKLSLIEK